MLTQWSAILLVAAAALSLVTADMARETLEQLPQEGQLRERQKRADVAREKVERQERERQVRAEVAVLRNTVASLARQSLLTQLHIEEKTRYEGDSGIKQVPHGYEGTKAYHSDTHISGTSVFSMHDHANHIRTIGMGQIAAVLNGVEFRTRHNDYSLRSPSRTSNEYQATTAIRFPEVPPEVLDKPTVAEEVEEMREWFRAFRDQDHSVRDYRPYFKPVLCYMEGMWTYVSDSVDESFESDRHFIDAASWFELQDKIRYHAYSGSKDSSENLAYLPRIVINVTEDGLPVFAQWNYDILCHPLSGDVPLNRLRVVDDLHARIQKKSSLAEFEHKRKARFQLNIRNESFTEDAKERHRFLDSLMYQIPGKDNYGAILRDSGLKDQHYKQLDRQGQPLNAAKYHRAFSAASADAMGKRVRFRGYADDNLYMALTTQDKVAGIRLTSCRWNRNLRKRVCNDVHQRWTYAIPLEIIYMTPLSNWNPYNIPYKGADSRTDAFKSVRLNGRKGNHVKAFNGTNSKDYYITPFEFYGGGIAGGEVDTDPADTTPPGAVHVLDSQGIKRLVRPAGFRMFLPKIEGVGIIRQRYPIAPVFAEGNTIWKELDALKDIVLDPLSYSHLIHNPITSQGAGTAEPGSLSFNFKTSRSNAATQGHVHRFTLFEHHIRDLRELKNITITSDQAKEHTHTFLLYAENGLISRVRYHTCDGRMWCSDGHRKALVEE